MVHATDMSLLLASLTLPHISGRDPKTAARSLHAASRLRSALRVHRNIRPTPWEPNSAVKVAGGLSWECENTVKLLSTSAPILLPLLINQGEQSKIT